jgi:hypothetical protein
MPMSSKWPLFLTFPNQNPIYTTPHPKVTHTTPITFFSGLFYPKNIWWGLQITKPLHHIISSHLPLFPHSLAQTISKGPNLENPQPTWLSTLFQQNMINNQIISVRWVLNDECVYRSTMYLQIHTASEVNTIMCLLQLSYIFITSTVKEDCDRHTGLLQLTELCVYKYLL